MQRLTGRTNPDWAKAAMMPDLDLQLRWQLQEGGKGLGGHNMIGMVRICLEVRAIVWKQLGVSCEIL